MIANEFSENYINNIVSFINQKNIKICDNIDNIINDINSINSTDNINNSVELDKKISSLLLHHSSVLFNNKNKGRLVDKVSDKYSIYK